MINSKTTTDSIFVDTNIIKLSSTSPIINGLSDHNAQILTIKNICATINKFSLKQRTRLIDNEIIMNFQALLKRKEIWESFNIDKDSSSIFNSFLCTFFNTFQTCFPVRYKSMKWKKKKNYIRNKNILQTQKKSVCLH